MVKKKKFANPVNFIMEIQARQADILTLPFRTVFGKVNRSIYDTKIVRASGEVKVITLDQTKVVDTWGMGDMLSNAILTYITRTGASVSPWRLLYTLIRPIVSTQFTGRPAKELLSEYVLRTQGHQLDRIIHIETKELDLNNAKVQYRVYLSSWEGRVSDELAIILSRLEYQRRKAVRFPAPRLVDVGAYWHPEPIVVKTQYLAPPPMPYYVTKAVEQHLAPELTRKFKDLAQDAYAAIGRDVEEYELKFNVLGVTPSEEAENLFKKATGMANEAFLRVQQIAKIGPR